MNLIFKVWRTLIFLLLVLYGNSQCTASYQLQSSKQMKDLFIKKNSIIYFDIVVPKDMQEKTSLKIELNWISGGCSNSKTRMFISNSCPTESNNHYISPNMSTTTNSHYLGIYHFDLKKSKEWMLGVEYIGDKSDSTELKFQIAMEEFGFYNTNNPYKLIFKLEPQMYRMFSYVATVLEENAVVPSFKSDPIVYGSVISAGFEQLDVYQIKNADFDDSLPNFGGQIKKGKMILESSIKDADTFYWLVKNNGLNEMNFIDFDLDVGKTCAYGCGTIANGGVCELSTGKCICSPGFWGSSCSQEGCIIGEDCSTDEYQGIRSCNSATAGYCRITSCNSFFRSLDSKANRCSLSFPSIFFFPTIISSVVIFAGIGLFLGLLIACLNKQCGQKKYYHRMTNVL